MKTQDDITSVKENEEYLKECYHFELITKCYCRSLSRSCILTVTEKQNIQNLKNAIMKASRSYLGVWETEQRQNMISGKLRQVI